jgi:excisionase family DNA binding protein
MEYLTTAEVAAILKIHENSVYKYIDTGALKASKLNSTGPWRITRQDLERFVAGER